MPRLTVHTANVIEYKQRRPIVQCEGAIVDDDKTALHCRATGRIAPVPGLLLAAIASIADPCGSARSMVLHAVILLIIGPVAMTIVVVIIAMTRWGNCGDQEMAALLVRITRADPMQTAPEDRVQQDRYRGEKSARSGQMNYARCLTLS